MSFNAWGERRDASSWGDFSLANTLSAMLSVVDAHAMTKGFTFHEHDDEVGLINMNGRLYDAALGRFISADPFVQEPEMTQSYNRYTYVMSNPLVYVDPSGYFWSEYGDFFSGVADYLGDVFSRSDDALKVEVSSSYRGTGYNSCRLI